MNFSRRNETRRCRRRRSGCRPWPGRGTSSVQRPRKRAAAQHRVDMRDDRVPRASAWRVPTPMRRSRASPGRGARPGCRRRRRSGRVAGRARRSHRRGRRGRLRWRSRGPKPRPASSRTRAAGHAGEADAADHHAVVGDRERRVPCPCWRPRRGEERSRRRRGRRDRGTRASMRDTAKSLMPVTIASRSASVAPAGGQSRSRLDPGLKPRCCGAHRAPPVRRAARPRT